MAMGEMLYTLHFYQACEHVDSPVPLIQPTLRPWLAPEASYYEMIFPLSQSFLIWLLPMAVLDLLVAVPTTYIINMNFYFWLRYENRHQIYLVT